MKKRPYNRTFIKTIFLAATALCCASALKAQCPEITIDEKYDHALSLMDRRNGWDTVANCKNGTLILHATPFVTTQHFNGTYLVESIPYNPVDPTFHAGTHLNISSDDAWESSTISFPFTFMFFGFPYTQALVGSNGLVSFTTTPMGQFCDYSYSVPIPSPSFPSKNAIYGVYEDIDPRGLTSDQGMFRSIGGTYPCRYLCASVNEVPLFPYSSNTTNRCTYQIVCYEGTNIIEVHIKKRSCCSTTNSGKGIVGIQNATGTTQESHYHDPAHAGQASFYIEPNSPGAFFPNGRGGDAPWTGTTQNEAWRFTPQGSTTKVITWWRLFEDAQGHIIDSVQMTNNPNDTNGFYMNSDHTQVSVTPTHPTKYMVKCLYVGANGHAYGTDGVSMRDIITVGVDFNDTMRVSSRDTVICEGQTSLVEMSYDPQKVTVEDITWSAVKIIDGSIDSTVVMPTTSYTVNDNTFRLNDQSGTLTPNRIDSIWVYCTATFTNGCSNHDSILLRTYPNFDIYDTMGICQGDKYRWCGQDYRAQGDYRAAYQSQPGCDSIRHLHLMVFDVSHTIDHEKDCKPYTWLNGKTYSADNLETMDQDTIVLKNAWNCDSVVTLSFTFQPMKAIISHTPEIATLDDMTIELRDQSYGHDQRMWLLPDNETSTSEVTYLNFPLNGVDTMIARLAVHNNFGCDDTATVVVPMKKVTIYAPNVFTPDRYENNRFQVITKGNIDDVQVWIYSRSGELITYFRGPDGYWDGTNSEGIRCPQGTYVYVARFHDIIDPRITQQQEGTITLIR